MKTGVTPSVTQDHSDQLFIRSLFPELLSCVSEGLAVSEVVEVLFLDRF